MSLTPPDDNTLRREALRFSIREAMCWMAVIAAICSLPTWFGNHALPLIFHATLIATTFRLRHLLPFQAALAIAFCSAVAVTWCMVFVTSS